MISKRYSLNGLILWAMLHAEGRWEPDTNEFAFQGIRHSCDVNSLGLPTPTPLLQEAIKREIDERWRNR